MSVIHLPSSATPGFNARSQSNQRRLFLLRNIVIAGQIAAIAAAVLWLDITLPLLPMGLVIATLALLNLRTWWQLRQNKPVSDAGFFAELLADAAALTALLALSGGSTNPFVSLYLLPIAVAAIALPARRAWLITAVTIVCYTGLLFFFLPLTHGEHEMHSDAFNLHILGMWVTFLASSILITAFVTIMAASIRALDRGLAAARERELRDEQVLALGTFAAGAAHELGTPLSTIAVLAKEMEIDYRDVPALRDDLQLLRTQIDQCKRIITGLTAAAGHARAGQASRQNVRHFVDDVLEKWTLLRAPVNLSVTWASAGAPPDIIGGETISQTVINVLNNAADASPLSVEIEVAWSAEALTIEVRDRGAGIADEVAAHAGRTPISTKSPNRGLGLFLANATIDRIGGSVALSNREGGGNCTRVTIPLAGASVAP
ncbi:MAG: ATP-binding protein [Betaproteobacteria bacterium]